MSLLQSLPKATTYILLGLLISCGITPLRGQEGESKPDIILSVNAFSFNDLLSAKSSRNDQQVYTLFNLLDWCASQNIKALDPTGYYFPTYPDVPSDEYLKRFKEYADNLGIAISGTGIRNNFASPDPKIRAQGIQLAKDWIIAASKIGAPVIRVFAGAIPDGYEDNWVVPSQWMIECYRELIPFAKKYNVKIGIQNHGEMLQTAEECLYVMKALNSEWVGMVLDIGSFRTEDPYKDIALMVPYAINWQVKDTPYGVGSPVKTDYNRIIEIAKAGGYSGYMPVESLFARGRSYDPFALVPAMIKALEEALMK